MKIAVVSDIHHYHWMSAMQKDSRIEHPITIINRSFEIHKPDLIIDAGDYEADASYYGMINIPLLKVPGNHDYYGTTWKRENIQNSRFQASIPGVKIVGATLWTDLQHPYGFDVSLEVKRFMMDFTAIRSFNIADWREANREHIKFLSSEGQGADIIVTHHSPSFKSVHPCYGDALSNYGFSSHLDYLITELNPKYWIHGHTHVPFDYMHGNTRVICNPCGYPHERVQREAYEPVYIVI